MSSKATLDDQVYEHLLDRASKCLENMYKEQAKKDFFWHGMDQAMLSAKLGFGDHFCKVALHLRQQELTRQYDWLRMRKEDKGPAWGLCPKNERLAINAAMHENCRAELHERWSHELGWDWLKGSNGRKRWTQVRKNAELEYYHLPAEFEWQAKTKSLHALARNSRSIKPDEKKTKIKAEEDQKLQETSIKAEEDQQQQQEQQEAEATTTTTTTVTTTTTLAFSTRTTTTTTTTTTTRRPLEVLALEEEEERKRRRVV